MNLQRYYDKLLHISITFMLLVWLDMLMSMVVTARSGSIGFAVTVTLLMQIIRTAWNYSADSTYRPLGDWMANCIGYVATVLFWVLSTLA